MNNEDYFHLKSIDSNIKQIEQTNDILSNIEC